MSESRTCRLGIQMLARTLGYLIAASIAIGCSAGPAPHTSQELGDRRYTVTITAPADLQTGASGLLVVEARPEAGHKLSTEFPTRLSLKRSAGLDAPEHLDRDAATDLREQHIRYVIPIAATDSGRQSIEGILHIGACTGDLCEPVALPFESIIPVAKPTR
ncbi:MAG: hypothetical protein GY723_06580 [bacterium]|nr:hypothetical protein [bacterium]MCP5069563.1 hypothetical protein [bacterium]